MPTSCPAPAQQTHRIGIDFMMFCIWWQKSPLWQKFPLHDADSRETLAYQNVNRRWQDVTCSIVSCIGATQWCHIQGSCTVLLCALTATHCVYAGVAAVAVVLISLLLDHTASCYGQTDAIPSCHPVTGRWVPHGSQGYRNTWLCMAHS